MSAILLKRGERKRGWGGILLVFALIGLVAVLTWAWVDGGEEPVRRIEMSVAVPDVTP